VFPAEVTNPDKTIRPAFRELRAHVSGFGLDPDTLLPIGIPQVVDGQLVSYDCCIEFPLQDAADTRMLPGGRFAVLTVEKIPARIGPAIRSFWGDYLPEHGLLVDEERPTYEIYFTDTLDYCVPVR
jgi:DNA gyrase inhibitor GyrI